MLDIQEAKDIVNRELPNGTIQSYIEYGGTYIFKVFTDLPGEEEMDPFYSVDQKTGYFAEFSMANDGTSEIASLFQRAKVQRGET